jgi:hypothetical protein
MNERETLAYVLGILKQKREFWFEGTRFIGYPAVLIEGVHDMIQKAFVADGDPTADAVATHTTNSGTRRRA